MVCVKVAVTTKTIEKIFKDLQTGVHHCHSCLLQISKIPLTVHTAHPKQNTRENLWLQKFTYFKPRRVLKFEPLDHFHS